MRKYCIYAIAAILAGGILTGCATTSMLKLTPEEQTYLEKAKAFPLEFTIPKSEADEAWGRAQSFIGRFSSMKLQTVTDFVIQTYNPGSGDVDFGYYVTKTPMGDKVQITVQCNTGNMFAGADANTNAHILAYYIKTGELVNPRLIAR
jgi:hypothetical protein